MTIGRKLFFFTAIITLFYSASLSAETARGYDELNNEVQMLREELKALNNSLPFRGDPNWGTGFTLGLRCTGMYGSLMAPGLELGYSWSPDWVVRTDFEIYTNPSDWDDSDYYAAYIGFLRRTPLSLNLRGYIGLFAGGVKLAGYQPKVSEKAMFGVEYYTQKNAAVFMEIGSAGPFTDDEKYLKLRTGFAISGIRFYF